MPVEPGELPVDGLFPPDRHQEGTHCHGVGQGGICLYGYLCESIIGGIQTVGFAFAAVKDVG